MKIKFALPFLVFLMMLLTSCEDVFEPKGTETRVYGRMYDNENQLPLTNHKLKISEYNLIPGFGPTPNIDFIQYLDSTTTDSFGYFELVFKTSGKGDQYYLETDFEHSNFYGLTDENVFSLNQSRSIKIENLGEDLEINYDITFYYPVELKFTLDADVQFLPIRISKPYSRYIDNLTETGIEISRIYQIDKNSNWQVILTRQTLEGQKQRVVFEMPPTNSSELTSFEFYVNDADFVNYF